MKTNKLDGLKNSKVKLIDFQEQYAKDFSDINLEWLEKYFYVEDYDLEILSNPEKFILDPGGYIFFALVDEKVAGTVALIKREGVYELSKMGVKPQFQGLGIGNKLMDFCIEFSKKQGWKRIFLDSNRKLTPAITLYQKSGFKEIPVPEDTPYERCNIRMELVF